MKKFTSRWYFYLWHGVKESSTSSELSSYFMPKNYDGSVTSVGEGELNWCSARLLACIYVLVSLHAFMCCSSLCMHLCARLLACIYVLVSWHAFVRLFWHTCVLCSVIEGAKICLLLRSLNQFICRISNRACLSFGHYQLSCCPIETCVTPDCRHYP